MPRIVLALAVACVLASPSAAQDRTKVFAAEKFQYTLPPGWEWRPLIFPDTLFMAARPDGGFIAAMAKPMPDSEANATAITPQQSAELEEVITSRGGTKRGSKPVTYAGTEWHESEFTNGPKTIVIRTTIAHRHLYMVMVAGDVVGTPEFDAAVAGFSFTELPPKAKSRVAAYVIGGVVGAVVLIGATIGISIAVRSGSRRPAKRRRRQVVEDDEDDRPRRRRRPRDD